MWAEAMSGEPIFDSNKVCYVILQLGIHEFGIANDGSKRALTALRYAKRVCRQIGVTLWPLRIGMGQNRSHYHYAFRFPWNSRNDAVAWRLGESLISSISVLCGPQLDDTIVPVLRVPIHMVRNKSCVEVRDLLKLEQQRAPNERSVDSLGSEFGSINYPPTECIKAAWRTIPALYHSDVAHRSFAFMCASYRDIYTPRAERYSISQQPDSAKQSAFDQSRKENAFLNAYKGIEAILGQPSTQKSKLSDRLRSIGLDPTRMVGYQVQCSLVEMIYRVESIRNKRAAHGSTRNRTISTAEVLECQSLAELVLFQFIESLLVQQQI